MNIHLIISITFSNGDELKALRSASSVTEFRKDIGCLFGKQQMPLYLEFMLSTRTTDGQKLVGETLATLWPSLMSSEKESIVARLQSHYKELRQLPSPGYYGSIDKQCLGAEIHS
ncbi:uncharacterized protein BDCG_17295 [Blastomyces dermatitidis ER-3]|uniref:Uncharacterized protein n=1 Tax=Ajellomyces dermatitidis (strain ER-3 / ATCC MYA-2586) TaxID=559297 RepID=A0ABX2VXQ5_AJEDR|nr:uncharacterized protein BDCG_17295 [Blastomyces dermatitidis ER-3]OAT01928.1 hypothetical protein BDCG_17295 [Blastomyces dermatitidis ER-3]